MPFTTLTDEEEKELYRLQRLYWREAQRCEKAQAYPAGCVMLGSALETLLILMVNVVLRVAKAANWLPAALNPDDDWNSRKARIGDYAEVVRMVRNLAHPARYMKDHYGKRVTNKYLERQFELVLLCRDWLQAHNNKALLEHMKAEGIA